MIAFCNASFGPPPDLGQNEKCGDVDNLAFYQWLLFVPQELLWHSAI
ncbi:hypothetical protein D349_00032 [Enterococcus faecalis UP2S-6]|nr:hypothetical protein D349_00032 [Enterococcus faecalis UP2S-6]